MKPSALLLALVLSVPWAAAVVAAEPEPATGRTLEEIQVTFDRNKGALAVIFNGALRDDPNLGAGKVVVSFTIAPDGSVTDCHLVTSTFHLPDLEHKIVQWVLLFNFGAKHVPPYTYPDYPIKLLPSREAASSPD